MLPEMLKGVILPLVIGFLIFLILREVMCWYWKINTIVRLLEDIIKKMNEVANFQVYHIVDNIRKDVHSLLSEKKEK
jgi:hypothetical protein